MKIIRVNFAYIVKEDGGIAVAEFANLPSWLFHILFGQTPGVENRTKWQIKIRR